MHIVTGLITNVVSFHPEFPYEKILQYLVPCSAQMNVSAGVWRAVNKVEILAVFVFLFRLLVRFILLPVGPDLPLYEVRFIFHTDLFYHRKPSGNHDSEISIRNLEFYICLSS